MTDTENGAAGVSFAGGEHVCVFYRGPGERDAFLREWVGAGFAAGDKCLCVAGAADAAAMADSLQAGAPAPPRPDQLTVLPVARYLTDGSFVPEAAFARWDALIGGYVGDGFERVRGVGDLSWVLDAGEPADPSRTGPLLRYEALCNTLVGRHPVSIACMYDLDRFGADVVAAVLDQHSAVLAGGVLFRADRPRCAGEVAAEAEAPELARRLLDGVAGGRPGVAEQASGFGLELGEPFRVGVARTSAGNDTEPLADLLATGGIHLVATRAGEVAFLAQDTDALGALAGALAGLCGAVGLGRAVRSVGNATSSYHQARRAAALAVEMDVPVVRYDDTGIFEVLAGGASPSLMEAFVAEWLGPLVIHDRSKRGDLTVTLAGYLGAGANQSAAAGALGLHVSTLKYRLARMAEVTGRDLSSPEVRFHLQAALHMRRTLNVLAAEGSAPSHPPIS